ncbi:eukaryotic translation initiation factor 2A [Caerostris darwini]|uniref:Eukaryotic translation initiation factor 2A n=1 Tax=Caerostris darwini TaxID=1538125 RepID=A0AAV4QJN9_9ARAC|nr:eukaryotic translation initiation factor 2A [Caerostris darwini]
MSVETSILALRGSKGIKFCYGPPNAEPFEAFSKVESPSCRDMLFASDGNLFSWCTNQRACATDCKEYKTLCKIDDASINSLHLSPKGTYLSTWSIYKAKENVQESCNLHIWEVTTGTCIKSFIQKKQSGWHPQWSDDEKICARNVNNEIHFFEDANFEKIAKKIFIQKVAYFSLAPGAAPYHVACFVPGMKGQPSFVRLFKYPNFDGPNAVIAQKSFFKAERTDFYWNKTGRDCIFLTSVDVDKSGMSYYGELNLYYASVKGDTAKIKLGKDGPVYSVQWNPNSTEFCVVYGFMPAKATVYNLKCEPLLDFDGAPRNEVNYSPVGDRLSLSGFGNLQGMIEVWDLKLKKKISQFKAQDSTYIQWSYDGEYILTATTAPRLRISNGFRIWHYTGSLLTEVFLDTSEELYDIKWKPVPNEMLKAKPTIFSPVSGIKSSIPEASKQVYRPPGAQGKQSSFKLHDEDSSKKEDASNAAAMTKNKKKNLARKAKKESEKLIEDNVEMPKTEPLKTVNNYSSELTGDPEKDKKIKSLLKKLNQIEKLKQDQATGKPLELNQLEKIKKAGELEAELASLQLN